MIQRVLSTLICDLETRCTSNSLQKHFLVCRGRFIVRRYKYIDSQTKKIPALSERRIFFIGHIVTR